MPNAQAPEELGAGEGMARHLQVMPSADDACNAACMWR